MMYYPKDDSEKTKHRLDVEQYGPDYDSPEAREDRRHYEAAERRAERSLDQDGPIDENDI